MSIYYESLCPDSIRFMVNQLKPNYEHFKDLIDIELVPFGKSEVSVSFNFLSIPFFIVLIFFFCLQSFIYQNRTEFSCQHGPAECTGNKIQSCTLNELKEHPDLRIKYVVCQMDPENEISEWTGEAVCNNWNSLKKLNSNLCIFSVQKPLM